MSTSAAGLVVLAIWLLAAKNDIAQARGIDKIGALGHLCFAIPLGGAWIVLAGAKTK